jgi:DNA-binding PadR family transcriptional regulator
MGRRDHLGEFEQLVLLAILRLKDEAYGMRIRRELDERAGRSTSIGALYLTLERLQEKGFIKSALGAATQERGGRAKRFFSVNPAGRQMLRDSMNALQSMSKGLIIPGVA